MSGKMRPVLLNQVLEELNIMDHQAHPALGKAKRNCIRALIYEKQEVQQTAPLTLEELRGMDGEWCWVVAEDGPEPVPMRIDAHRGRAAPAFAESCEFDNYGPGTDVYYGWLAYRRPPEQ